jgi:hypothetical protein
MGPNGIADFDFGYASLERVGGVGKVCLVPFAVCGKFVGEVGVVEKFKAGPGMFLIADCTRRSKNRPRDAALAA